MGLHKHFAQAKGQILMINSLQDVNHACALIKQDEKMKQGYVPKMSDTFIVGSITNRCEGLSNYAGSYEERTMEVLLIVERKTIL